MNPTLQLKISLQWIDPPIWRRVLVPADITLAKLHSVIQTAMGWEDVHLHQFRVEEEVYQAVEKPRLGLVSVESSC